LTDRLRHDPLTPALRLAYRASGLTIPQLAARAEVSEKSVYMVLAGRGVQTRTLFQVCRALNVRTIVVPVETDEIRAT
jgi:DNA-binding phage protein